jgi:Ca-activated chloride channel homolog
MKTLRAVTMALLLVVLWLGQAFPASADGVIIPILPPVPPHPPVWPRPLAIEYHRVTVTIDEQVATTHVDQVFVNESPHDMEGEYLFPLPVGATISRFAMWVDGRPLEAQVLDCDEARRIYEDIVRERRDPALLEYVDRGAFRARIYPIPAWGEKRIEIEYSEVLSADGGLVRYVYPLSTEKFSSRPLDEASVTVHVSADQEIRALYSPSHAISERRVGDREVEAVYRETGVVPSKDFVLYYSVGEGEPSANLMTYRDAGEDGFFLLLLAPGQQAGPEEVVPRDVIFVLDTSGSMRGNKLAQAKGAARYVLENLNEEDRFNVIAFSTATRAFARGLRPRDEARQAASLINGLRAGGGTNIGRAFEEALALTDPERQQVILFLTDGLPTEGEIRTDKLVEQVAEDAGDSVRIFCFGVGYDVNTILLDVVAQDHNGTSAYVLPDEDIERVVSSLYEKISRPVLTDVALDYGVTVEEVYPYPLPDLFAGGQLVVVGRYRMSGEADITATVTLRGRADDHEATYRYRGMRFSGEGGADFIPRLWATRKIGYLLTQIRLHGAQRELVDEIVELSVRYGIVTPYTSFLIDETEDALSSEGRNAIVGREMMTAPSADLGRGGAGGPASGEAAVQSSIAQEALRKADAVIEPESERVQTVGSRAFVLRDGVWVDTTYDATTMTPQRVAFASERYFELMRAHPDWGRYLAIGERVILVWEGRGYAFGEEGEQAPRGEPTAMIAPPPPATATPSVAAASEGRSPFDWWKQLVRR